MCVFHYRCHHYYGVKENIMVLQCFFISPKCFIMFIQIFTLISVSYMLIYNEIHVIVL